MLEAIKKIGKLLKKTERIRISRVFDLSALHLQLITYYLLLTTFKSSSFSVIAQPPSDNADAQAADL